ncbi:MAG: flippase-like domain-containing protein [Actinomycetia bacterium]|nr:flippase-like domain-containing protein [Actinomycetes bacterium]
MNRRTTSPHARFWLLGTALVLFVGVSVVSFRSLPKGLHLRLWLLPVLMLGTTPLTALANAAEYRVMGRMCGYHVTWMNSARLTVIATAANLLPLPGGIVIRMQALRQQGSNYGRAFVANLVAFVVWLGAGSLVIGLLFVATDRNRLAGAALLVAGILCLALMALLLRKVAPEQTYQLLGSFVVVEAWTVAVSGLRLYLAFRLIGLSASPAQAVALTASMIIAAAVGIFPAGLGIRELIAGGIGAAVALSAGESVAATASDRIASQLGFALLAGSLLALGRRRGDAAQQPPEADRPHRAEDGASA